MKLELSPAKTHKFTDAQTLDAHILQTHLACEGVALALYLPVLPGWYHANFCAVVLAAGNVPGEREVLNRPCAENQSDEQMSVADHMLS